MIRPDISTLNDSQILYIEDLERRLNGASHLIQQLNMASDIMARDLSYIMDRNEITVLRDEEGNEKFINNLIFLSSNKDSKVFERTMALFDKIDKIKALAQITVETSEEKKPQKKLTNLQDIALNPPA
jgi:uncharacterized protein YrzB (UPF0473 family)